MLSKILFSLSLASSLVASQKDNCSCCAKKAVFVLVISGKSENYCQQHMPEIERVKRLTPERLAEILRRNS